MYFNMLMGCILSYMIVHMFIDKKISDAIEILLNYKSQVQ